MSLAPPTAPGSGSLPIGWYVVSTTDGKIGIVNHTSAGAINLGHGDIVKQAILLTKQEGQSFDQTIANYGAALDRALQQLGATPQQQQSLIAQIDEGAGSHNPNLHQLLIDLGGNPAGYQANGQPANTAHQGDVTAGGVNIPGVSSPLQAISDVLSWLTTPSNWVRILEYIGGAILILVALKEMAK